jgi:hypothetical protein
VVITIQADRVAVSNAERERLARHLRCALSRFRPRVRRATLRIGRRRRTAAYLQSFVRVAVPLGPAGVVRVEVRGVDVGSCAAAAIRRVADKVARQLLSERQELLEFLLLASGGLRGWPARC